MSGRIVTSGGRQLLSGALMMLQVDEEVAAPTVRNVRIEPDGIFLFRNVDPGRYLIRAHGEVDREGPVLYGDRTVTVGTAAADGIIITLTPGALVEGRLEPDRAGQLQLDGGYSPRVRAVASDGIAFGDAVSEPLQRDGRFRFRGIMPGEHVFRAEGLPPPWILNAVYLDGRDITDVPIPLRSNQRLRNLRVVVTDGPKTGPLEVGTASRDRLVRTTHGLDR